METLISRFTRPYLYCGIVVLAGVAWGCSSYSARPDLESVPSRSIVSKTNPNVAETSSSYDGDLDDLMSEELNRQLTYLSFQLFHNRNESEEERLENIAKGAVTLRESAQKILHFEPPMFEDQTADYEEITISLTHYATGMHESAIEGNMPESVMWFSHVKNTCSHASTRR
ncbi:MAG: hypothetical protein AAF517_25190 [Planctomycetota bacterium]